MQKTRETQVRSLGQEDPLEKEVATTSVFLPGKFHGQRSPGGYSPWGHKRVRHNWAPHTVTYWKELFPLVTFLFTLLMVSFTKQKLLIRLLSNISLSLYGPHLLRKNLFPLTEWQDYSPTLSSKSFTVLPSTCKPLTDFGEWYELEMHPMDKKAPVWQGPQSQPIITRHQMCPRWTSGRC